MAKKRVFIGVGHGGSDPGAVKYVKEADANLNIALEMKRLLEANGNFIVGISRTRDENDDLVEEIQEANAFGPDLAFEVHNNAGGGDGWECFIQTNGYAAKSKAAAQAVEKRVKAIGQNSRGLKTRKNSSGYDYFGWLRQVKAPAILTEGFFVDSKDAYDFDTVAEQKKLAAAYALGVMDYFGISGSASSSAPAVQPETTPTVANTAKVEKGDVVTVAYGAVYYDNGITIPAWVRASKWIVRDVGGDRVVIDKSTDGKHSINSPVHAKYLTVEKSSATDAYSIDPADRFKGAYAGTYTVDANGGLFLRTGASTDDRAIELMDDGSKVSCYGYYTGDWLYVVSAKGNVGFAHKNYLKK